MNRTKLPIRKRLENVPQFSGSDDAAVAEVPQSTLAFDTNDIYGLRLFLKTPHISFRDQALENNRTKSENSMLKKRNDCLETKLLSMLKNQKERDDVVYVKEKLLEKYAYLEMELAKEREVIKLWTNSGKTTQEILEKDFWGSGLGYSARSNSDKKSRKETEKIEPIKTDSEVKLYKVQIKTIKFNPSFRTLLSLVVAAMLRKLALAIEYASTGLGIK
ncbi:hypothetical protein AgCh_001181 [Apium graveolens]